MKKISIYNKLYYCYYSHYYNRTCLALVEFSAMAMPNVKSMETTSNAAMVVAILGFVLLMYALIVYIFEALSYVWGTKRFSDNSTVKSFLLVSDSEDAGEKILHEDSEDVVDGVFGEYGCYGRSPRSEQSESTPLLRGRRGGGGGRGGESGGSTPVPTSCVVVLASPVSSDPSEDLSTSSHQPIIV